jgi:hypothetical protein
VNGTIIFNQTSPVNVTGNASYPSSIIISPSNSLIVQPSLAVTVSGPFVSHSFLIILFGNL